MGTARVTSGYGHRLIPRDLSRAGKSSNSIGGRRDPPEPPKAPRGNSKAIPQPMLLTRDGGVSSVLGSAWGKESSWCQRKGREGLGHPRVTHIHALLSLTLFLPLLDLWGCSALAGKCHVAEILTELPKEQMLLTGSQSLQ